MQPKQDPATTIQQVGDELLVLDRTTDRLHRLNITASWIFTHCDGMTTTRELIDRMVEQFDVDRGVAERDVATVLARLEELGLIETSSDG